MPLTIRVIDPASQAPAELLRQRVAELESQGFRVLWQEPVQRATPWPLPSAPLAERLAALLEALREEGSQLVLCARGGYGASDLLPALPWESLRHTPPKLVVGFSDISSLQSALWTQLGWPSVHGPMPATDLWAEGGEDVQALLSLFKSPVKQGQLELRGVSTDCAERAVQGWLFGGCFSVLSNLIGTPYFPASLAGAVLFLEDTGEGPGRLMRYWNQWLQSGVLQGVKALVLGDFCGLQEPESCELRKEFARRVDFPVWSCPFIGHTSPNYPVIIGAQAQLLGAEHRLDWQWLAS